MAYSFIPLLRGTDANEARRSHQQHGVVYFTKIAERIRTDLAKKKVVLVPFPRATPDIDRDGLGCFELPSNCRVGPRKMYHHSSPFFFISIFYFFGFIFLVLFFWFYFYFCYSDFESARYEIFGEFEDLLGLVHSEIAQYRDQLLAIGVKQITGPEILIHLSNPLLFENKPPKWWLGTSPPISSSLFLRM